MTPIVLLKNFTFTGDSGQSWSTDWVQFPAGYLNAQLVLVVKSRIGASAVTFVLETSWDTDNETTVATINAGAPGMSISDVTSNLGPMVRLTMTATANSQMVVSVYLTPKSS